MSLTGRTIPGSVALLGLSASIWLHCGSAHSSMENERHAAGNERKIARD